jgi:ribosome-binding factor A
MAWRRLCPFLTEATRIMSRKRSNRTLEHLAAELAPEDGGDPKEFHAKPWDVPKAPGRKALQLCEQVKDALHSALAACGNEMLQRLTVMSVEPAPNTGRLLVIVSAGADDRVEVVRHLRRAAGLLRAEATAAICRKYAPELAFEVVG